MTLAATSWDVTRLTERGFITWWLTWHCRVNNARHITGCCLTQYRVKGNNTAVDESSSNVF